MKQKTDTAMHTAPSLRWRIPRIAATLLCILLSITARVTAQDIASIAKSDPLIISGAIGTQNTYYHTSSGMGYASPLSTSLYANLNINLYGISMPFSFYYTGDNTSFSFPRFSFNISPTYKGWTLHLGQRSMSFSPYTFTMPFNGVGIEYRSQKAGLRFGAFYGDLRKAVNADPEDPSARAPMYRRTGMGVKVGYGTSRSYLDLYVFRGKDHLNSIDDYWHDQIFAQENVAVGLRGRLALGSHFSFSGNFGTSVFTTDLRSTIPDVDLVHKYDDYYDIRFSSLARFAGDISVNTNWKYFSASLYYRLIQPDYTSLGVSYITNNYQSLGINAGTHIGRLSLNGNLTAQSDNLDGDQLYTTRGYVYSANASLPLDCGLNLTAGYNGYTQRQYDGAAVVPDSTRIHRTTSSFSFSPSYEFTNTYTNNNISLSANYTSNADLNPYATGESDVQTLAIGAGYSLSVIPIETNFSFNYSHQQSEGYNSQYSTDIYSLSSSRAFLESRALSATLTLSLISNTMSGSGRNTSMGGNIGLGYTLREVHSFSFSASYNRYVNTNIVEEIYLPSSRHSDIMCSLSYNYTFNAISIKRQTEEKAKENKKRYIITSDFTKAAREERRLKALEKRNLGGPRK